MKIPDLTPTDLVKNLLAFVIVSATVFVYVMKAVSDPSIIIPLPLEAASVACLSVYGINIAQTAKANAALKKKNDTK